MPACLLLLVLVQDPTDDELLEQLRTDDLDVRDRAMGLLQARVIASPETEARVRLAFEKTLDEDLRAHLSELLRDLRRRRAKANYRFGEPVAQLMGHAACTLAFASSPDGNRFASSYETGIVVLWSEELERIREWRVDKATTLAFSPDGRTLAAGGPSLRLFDVESGKEQATLLDRKGSAVLRLRFLEDGRHLLAALSGSVVTIDLERREVRRENECPGDAILDLRTDLALCYYDDGSLTLWNLEKGSAEWDVRDAASSGRILGDGRVVLATEDTLWAMDRDKTRLWKSHLIGPLVRLDNDFAYSATQAGIERVDLSSGEKRPIDRKGVGFCRRELVAWNAEGRKIASGRVDGGPARALVFSGARLYTLGDDRRLLSWKLEDRTVEWEHEFAHVEPWQMRAAGNSILLRKYYEPSKVFRTDTRTFHPDVFDVGSDGTQALFEGEIASFPDRKEPKKLPPTQWWAPRFAAKGKFILTLTNDNALRVLRSSDLSEQKRIPLGLSGTSGYLRGMDLSISSSWESARIAVEGKDGIAHVIDLETGGETRVETGEIGMLLLNRNGRELLTIDGPTVRMHELDSGASQDFLKMRSDSGMIAFSPDGHLVAHADGPIRIWSAQGLELLAQIEGSYSAIAFSPDGQWLAAVSPSKTTLWRIGRN